MGLSCVSFVPFIKRSNVSVMCELFGMQRLNPEFPGQMSVQDSRDKHQGCCLAQFYIRFIRIHLLISQTRFNPMLTNCMLKVPTVLTIYINLKLFWKLVNCGVGLASKLKQVYEVVLPFSWGLWFHFSEQNPRSLYAHISIQLGSLKHSSLSFLSYVFLPLLCLFIK